MREKVNCEQEVNSDYLGDKSHWWDQSGDLPSDVLVSCLLSLKEDTKRVNNTKGHMMY